MLSEIQINHVRNIEEASIRFGSKFNVFYGANGSGKTSVIEGIYLLATAKSFRTNQIRKIINENNHSLTVFGRIARTSETLKVGVEKTEETSTIRLNGKNIKAVSELAECLPVLVIEQDSHQLLESGPQFRRKFIDWGLFHVKHHFNSVSVAYRKSLKQRNALLFQGSPHDAIQSWTEGFADLGESYTSMREEYLEALTPYIKEYVKELLQVDSVSIVYRRGWPKDLSLLDCLYQNIERDRANGRTNYGPHRADIVVQLNGKDVRGHVSRGQQKLLVYAFNLAQVSYLKEVQNKETILLLDDLGSELDPAHARGLLQLLSESFGQICITTANLETIPISEMEDVKLFHVKHGSIESIERNNELSRNND